MTDEPCTESNCSAQMHPASEGHIDGPGELERLRAEVAALRAGMESDSEDAADALTEAVERAESAEAALARVRELVLDLNADADYRVPKRFLSDRLRAALDDASPASIPVSSPRTLPQVLGMTADDEAAMQASLSESFAAIRAAERRAATSPPVVLGAANDDCPHAAPFRYCDGCAVSPCPIGLD